MASTDEAVALVRRSTGNLDWQSIFAGSQLNNPAAAAPTLQFAWETASKPSPESSCTSGGDDQTSTQIAKSRQKPVVVGNLNDYCRLMAISESTALGRLQGRGLNPIGTYPGAASHPWLLRCELCGKETLESLNAVEKRIRPGCRRCCSRSQNRLSSTEAASRLEAAKLGLKGDYPGTVSDQLQVECLICGLEFETTLSRTVNAVHPACPRCRASRPRGRITAAEARTRMRAAGLEPLEPYPGKTHSAWRHRCRTCRNETLRSLNAIESQYPCGQCRRNAIAKQRAQAAKRAMNDVGLEPLVDYPGASAPWKSRCTTCKNTVSPTLMSIRTQGPCHFCGRRRLSQRRVAASQDRALAQMRLSGFEPTGEYHGFAKPWPARCRACGRKSSPSPKSLASGQGCKWCAPNAPWSLSKFKGICSRANRTPLEPFSGAHTAIVMKCNKCGAEAKTRPSSLRTSSGYCDRCKPSARWTAERALQVMRAAGMEPLEPFPGSRVSWKSQCTTCQTVGAPALANIASGQGGCKICGNFGFDVRKPTTLYVLLHQTHRVFKVGITNTGSTRLRDLERVGFVPGRLYEFKEGSEPLRIETLVLRHLRTELGLSQALTPAEMHGVGGATETFWRDDVDTRVVHARIRRLLR